MHSSSFQQDLISPNLTSVTSPIAEHKLAQKNEARETCEPGNSITLFKGIIVCREGSLSPHSQSLLPVTRMEKPVDSHTAAAFALHIWALPPQQAHVRGPPASCKMCPLTLTPLVIFSEPSRHVCRHVPCFLEWWRRGDIPLEGFLCAGDNTMHAGPQGQMWCLAVEVTALQWPKLCPHTEHLLFRAWLLNMQRRGGYTTVLAMPR